MAIKLLGYVKDFETNDAKLEHLFSTIANATKNKFASIYILHINYQEHIRYNHLYTSKLIERIKHLRKLLNINDAKFSRLMIDSDGIVMKVSGEQSTMHKVEYLSSNCNLMFGYSISELKSLNQI